MHGEIAETEALAADAPDWFRRALAARPESRRVEVAGCPIHYLRWRGPGDGPRPGLLLVHGNGAHARWWSFIAPFFTADHDVAALDLGGMGDSGTRESYTPELFAAEIFAVAEDAGFAGRPVVVGHSFGGFMTLVAASLRPDAVAGVVLADSPVRPPEVQARRRRKRSSGRKPVYADFATALSRFRLLPDQPCANGYIVDYIARHSLKPVPGGWTWKFDASPWDAEAFGNPFWVSLSDRLASLRCRFALMRGSDSALFTPEIEAHMTALAGDRARFIVIPEAHHHLMLDQPLAFVAALRAVLAGWGPLQLPG